ncbi:MAG: response regulator [Tepidisphaeraceae bacterium]
MSQTAKVLVLTGHHAQRAGVIELLKQSCSVVETSSIDDALVELRKNAGEIAGVFSDAEDFLPLERALVSQQANLVLNTVGEGVCIVDGSGRCNWQNKKMAAWPARVHEVIRRTCLEAFEFFSRIPPAELLAAATPKSRRFALNVEDQQYMELIASPVVTPSGQVVQIVAVAWDATNTRKLQQKIDAIDRAGRELMRLDADEFKKLNVGERLKLIEEKIVSYTRELMHFDHFAIRLLNPHTNELEIVMSAGLPREALDVQLYAESEGNGISGYVAASGRSYICPDVERDPRYVPGLDHAMSSLTVPLKLNDKVIGICNVESRQRGAFTEDDRQFAEIFGRYVAMALNTLDLMVKERVETSHTIADNVASELAGPLNDIALDVTSMMEDFIQNDELTKRLQTILTNLDTIRTSLRQAAVPNATILGAKELEQPTTVDPVIAEARVLIVDDEPNIRQTIADVLRKYQADVTVCAGVAEAVKAIGSAEFDLILSDIKMPDGTGYEVFAASRTKPNPPPVVLMTGFGYDPSHCIVRASQEGLHAVMFKPFRVEQLLDEVRRALANRAALSGQA